MKGKNKKPDFIVMIAIGEKKKRKKWSNGRWRTKSWN